jgi:hypothetical protein
VGRWEKKGRERWAKQGGGYKNFSVSGVSPFAWRTVLHISSRKSDKKGETIFNPRDKYSWIITGVPRPRVWREDKPVPLVVREIVGRQWGKNSPELWGKEDF